MKKALKKAFFLSLIVPMIAWGSRSAYPSLLPSNPFYFTKEGVRNLRRALTFNPSSKVDLELRIASERLSEIVKLIGIKTADLDSVLTALNGYQSSLVLLEDSLNLLKKDDANLERLMASLTESILEQHRSLNNLVIALKDKLDIEKKITEINDLLYQILVFTINRFQTAEEFRVRAKSVIYNYKDPLAEFAALELLADLDRFLKEDLLINFANHIKGGRINYFFLESLPGNSLLRLKLIDEAREKVEDFVLKSQIAFIRQQFLERMVAVGLVNNFLVTQEIDNVQKWLADLEMGRGIKITDQIRHSLSEAQKALIDGGFGFALSHISLANALLNNLNFEIYFTADERLREVFLLKKEYDVLSEKNRNLFLEKQILELSELTRKNPLNSQVIVGIRKIKLALAQLRNQ